MESDDDFTFCQVGGPVDQNSLEAQKVARNIRAINIKDETTNGSSSKQSSGILWNNKLFGDAALQKQTTVGSLSFSVIDASSREESKERAKQMSVENGNSVLTSREQKNYAKKPAPRAKVPFEKGYSPMDWMRLTQTHRDLAGLKGQSNKRLISLDEVKQHQTEGSMWTVLKGRVYNVAPYMKYHPGGVDMLMKAVGKDCTSLFNKYHAWVNAEFLLEKCLVGTLDDSH